MDGDEAEAQYLVVDKDVMGNQKGKVSIGRTDISWFNAK
jgi:hypothetical protein